MKRIRYDYAPHPGPQAEAHRRVVDELLYGGAAGGGKSRFARAAAVLDCLRIPGFRAIIFRRTFPDLERAVINELRNEIPQGIARYNDGKHIWRFHNGSVLELGYLKNRADLMNYQGAEYGLAVFEEATQFELYQYLYIQSRLRAAGPVRDRMAELGLRPRSICTANPGGIGHHWVKGRWIDPAPEGVPWRPKPTPKDKRPGTRLYIPARVTDNPSLGDDYVDRLDRLPERTRQALKFGDWDILEGVRFPTFNRNAHVIPAGSIDLQAAASVRAVGVDWGGPAPFAAVWGAKLTDGTVVIYREAYRKGLTPYEQGALVRSMETPEEVGPRRPLPIYLDPATWARGDFTPGVEIPDDGTPPPGSIAYAFEEAVGRTVYKARNDRIGGWALVDEHLRIREDGLPRLFITDNCRELIRTLPALQSSHVDPNDVSKTPKQEDHVADAARYLLQALAGSEVVPAVSEGDHARRRASRPVDPLANMTR